MRLPLWPLVCVALSGCAACGPPVITGEVRLAVDVDPNTFATLEMRGYATLDPETLPPDLEPAYTDSIPIADVKRFPYEFVLEEQRTSGFTVFLHAWLARDANGPIAARAGEPYGKTVVTLCECASEGPAYASDVVLVIDSIAE